MPAQPKKGILLNIEKLYDMPKLINKTFIVMPPSYECELNVDG